MMWRPIGVLGKWVSLWMVEAAERCVPAAGTASAYSTEQDTLNRFFLFSYRTSLYSRFHEYGKKGDSVKQFIHNVL